MPSEALNDLFIRPASHLEDSIAAAYREQRERRAAEERTLDEIEHQKELATGPLLAGQLAAMRLQPDVISEAITKRGAIVAGARRWQGAAGPRGLSSSSVRQIANPRAGSLSTPTSPSPGRCTTINVRVCKERVCIAQPVPLSINDIRATTGSDGSFTRIGTDSFVADDSVMGTSSWNLTYHRQSRTHDGQIVIAAAGSLIQPSKVLRIGAIFEAIQLDDNDVAYNGAITQGDCPAFLPSSWGQARMYRQLNITCQDTPGGPVFPWCEGGKQQYLDTGRNDSPIYVSGNYDETVLGGTRLFDFGFDRTENVPAGTTFWVFVALDWWIKALGEGGFSTVYYALRVRPYIHIEACSMQFPDTMTIHPGDYF